MNLRRGIRRIGWIVAGLYAIGCAVALFDIRFIEPVQSWAYFFESLGWQVGVGIAAFAIFRAAGWAVQGFRSDVSGASGGGE